MHKHDTNVTNGHGRDWQWFVAVPWLAHIQLPKGIVPWEGSWEENPPLDIQPKKTPTRCMGRKNPPWIWFLRNSYLMTFESFFCIKQCEGDLWSSTWKLQILGLCHNSEDLLMSLMTTGDNLLMNCDDNSPCNDIGDVWCSLEKSGICKCSPRLWWSKQLLNR